MTNPSPPAAAQLYQTEDGQTRLDVALRGETVWLSLNQLAHLFQRDKSVISRHIKNVFEEGELPPEATVADFAIVQSEGDRRVERQFEHFNLDVIISVGHRASHRGSDIPTPRITPCTSNPIRANSRPSHTHPHVQPALRHPTSPRHPKVVAHA